MKSQKVLIALFVIISSCIQAQESKQEIKDQQEEIKEKRKEVAQQQKEIGKQQRELNEKRREINEKERSKEMMEKREDVKSMKIAYFTTKLNLTSAEAEKFWPIYNEFENVQFEKRNKKMETLRDNMDDDSLDNMSEKDAIELLAALEKMETDLFNSRRDLNAKLKNILPAIKIIKLRKAEMDFNRKLLGHFKGKRVGMMSTEPGKNQFNSRMKPKDMMPLDPLQPIPPLRPEPLMGFPEE